MRHRLISAVLAIAALIMVAACGSTPPPPDPARSFAIAVQSNAAALEPSLGSSLTEQVRTRAEDPDTDDVVAHVISGRDRVETVDLEPRRPNGRIERGTERIRVLVAERLDVLHAAIRRAAATGTVDDPLAALSTAGHTGAGTVIMLSAGVTTTHPIDQRVLWWDHDPVALATGLRDRRLLPGLTDRDVVFGGLGRTTGDQPLLGLREQAILRDQWTAICTAAGAARCLVDDAVRDRVPPSSQVRTPPVPVLPVVTRSAPGVWEVPSPLLFRPDSCDLLDPDAAARLLAPLVDQLVGGGHQVSISGRTAPVGTGDGVDLARCRATAAAGLLERSGVPRDAIAQVRGDGSALDPPAAALGPDGRPDPAKLAALRRVVFTVEKEERS